MCSVQLIQIEIIVFSKQANERLFVVHCMPTMPNVMGPKEAGLVCQYRRLPENSRKFMREDQIGECVSVCELTHMKEIICRDRRVAHSMFRVWIIL